MVSSLYESGAVNRSVENSFSPKDTATQLGLKIGKLNLSDECLKSLEQKDKQMNTQDLETMRDIDMAALTEIDPNTSNVISIANLADKNYTD